MVGKEAPPQKIEKRTLSPTNCLQQYHFWYPQSRIMDIGWLFLHDGSSGSDSGTGDTTKEQYPPK